MRDNKKKYPQTIMVRDITESLGKLPPQSLDVEESVLGAVMLERRAIKEIGDFLHPEHFYSEQHKEIFQAIVELFRNERPIDMRTVIDLLRKNGKIELVGGAYYIAELTSKVSSAANVEYHARIIIEKWLKRETIMIASKMHQEAYEDTSDPFELLEESSRSILKITPVNTRNISDAKSILQATIANMQAKKGNNGVVGVPSGYYSHDRVTFGWQKANLIIIAARPSMGKTAWVLNIILNAVIKFAVPVAFFSLEMSKIQLGERVNAILSEIELEKIIKGELDEFEWRRIMEATAEFARSPLYIDDSAALSIFDMKARAKRMKEEYGIQMIVVDYLQLMKGDKDGNREQEISSISRGLKELSKDLDVPVIALSQLSRSVETRGGDKRPMLSDLRESGSIEQDADVVEFLYRPAYYGIMTDQEGNGLENVMEVIIAKNRQGALDNIVLKFIGKYTKVMDYVSSPVQTKAPAPRMPYRDDAIEDTGDLPF